jgi:hypothetical protein
MGAALYCAFPRWRSQHDRNLASCHSIACRADESGLEERLRYEFGKPSAAPTVEMALIGEFRRLEGCFVNEVERQLPVLDGDF